MLVDRGYLATDDTAALGDLRLEDLLHPCTYLRVLLSAQRLAAQRRPKALRCIGLFGSPISAEILFEFPAHQHANAPFGRNERLTEGELQPLEVDVAALGLDLEEEAQNSRRRSSATSRRAQVELLGRPWVRRRFSVISSPTTGGREPQSGRHGSGSSRHHRTA